MSGIVFDLMKRLGLQDVDNQLRKVARLTRFFIEDDQ